MKVSGCIVTYNSGEDIIKCIKSILEYTKDMDFTLYISDNASTDNTVELIKQEFSGIEILENSENGGYGYGHNKVIEIVDSDYHVVINPDIELRENAILGLVEYLEKESAVGLVTPKILNNDGSEQYLPKQHPKFKYVVLSKFPGLRKYRREYTMQDTEFLNPTKVKFCTGCFFASPTKILREVKGFDDTFYMYFEDADLSRRIEKAGYDIIFNPEYSVCHDWHRENTKSIKGITRFITSMIKYFNRWGWR